jgi:peptidylamidoglycolate lyase
MDPNGNVAIFHRGNRIWGSTTFDNLNKFDPNNGPIAQNTIILLDKSGKIISEWGKDMFYLPHGLTIDQSGNYWITDVAMHQVFKFDARDVARHAEESQGIVPKPSMTLGEAFVPGNDEKRFCKPTAVAVHSNGDFFVSDGYCNSRIIKFNEKGERILHWGRHWGMGGNETSVDTSLISYFRFSFLNWSIFQSFRFLIDFDFFHGISLIGSISKRFC